MRPCWLGVAVLITSCGDGPPPPPPAPCQALTDDGGGVTVGSGLDGDPAIPRPATPYQAGRGVVRARSYMVVTANPLASRAGCDVLQGGGTAADAAIAVQAVLGLVEPQSSGIGGGAFLLYYDAKTGAVHAYDGREAAPAAATEDYLRFVDAGDRTPPQPSARASGRSIGTPGVLHMLELVHREHGRIPWGLLLVPAIDLAINGFAVSGRLALAIDEARGDLLGDPEAAATYFDAAGRPVGMGATLTVPAYGATLTALAADPGAFYRGELAQAIVDKIAVAQRADGAPITPGLTTLADLAGYEARRRDPVCVTYRAHWICGMPPPSSGGLAVAASLGVLEHFELPAPTDLDREGGQPTVAAVHLISEAERLAYADRDRYVADPDVVPLPGGSPDLLLARPYLAARAQLISTTSSLGTAPPGVFGAALADDHTPEHGTTHATIVDADGDVAVLTTTIEGSFGAFHMTRGFVLNNQLTDFSAEPTAGGVPIANRVGPGKRPRSSMAPTLVFEVAADGSRGSFAMATGSPGGATIIQYVVKTLVGALDWGLDAQQATSMIDFGAANDPVTNVGGEHPNVDARDDRLVTGLRALGHTVNVARQTSGIATVIRAPTGELTGGADPRRDGVVLGDLVPP